MARFSLISLNLIRWEGALSRYRNCIERLVGRLRPHDGWHLQILGFLLLEKIKLWRQEKVGVGMANLPASGQGGAKGREGGASCLDIWKKSCQPDGWAGFIHLSLRLWSSHLRWLIFLLGKNLENRENRGCPLLEGRAQNQPGSDFQVEYWGKLFGTSPVSLYFLGLFQSIFICWAFSSHPFIFGVLFQASFY